ncbi:hypothetical protein AAHC03_021043 [Spirometra sp. Aus1]
MWKLVFSLLVVVGILEQVNAAKMADAGANEDKLSNAIKDGEPSNNQTGEQPPQPSNNNTAGQPVNPGNGAQNLWLSGGHTVAALLLLALCLH